MKKNSIIILGSFLVLLTSCWGNTGGTSDLERAKQELLGNVPIQDNKKVESENDREQQESDIDKQNQSKSYITVRNITSAPIIKFDSFEVSQFEDMKEELTGTINGEVTKVTVLHTNPNQQESATPYTLSKFTAGDKTFLFNAFKKYATLDYWLNTYRVTAYEWDKQHTIEMNVFIQDPKNAEKVEESKEHSGVVTTPMHTDIWGIQHTTVTAVDLNTLPKNEKYGNPVAIGNGDITYSDIKGFDIKNVGKIELSVDPRSITKYVQEHYNGWFFWNTVTPISKGKGVTFYVVFKPTKTGEYVYQKHYYDGEKLYGVLNLESGILPETMELKDKNTELSQINDSFTTTVPATELFRDIMK